MLLELPTVSIIVFAYDGISYLSATLDSILQQTLAKYEVIIFSNNPHHPIEWLKDWLDYRFKFIFQESLGIAQTFNQGITVAQGEYISFMVAGDLWHPHKLQKQVFCLDCYQDVGLIHCWQLSIDHHGRSADKIIRHQHSASVEISAYDKIALSSVMVRHSCLEVVGLFDPKLHIIPDWDLWMRLSDRYQCMTIAEPLVYCRKYYDRIAENFRVVETDLQTIIEKAHDCANSTLFLPKNRSYAHASLFLAGKVLQHKEADPAIADNYCHQALQHHPFIGLSAEFCRIRLAIIFLFCLKSPNSSLRRFIQTASSLLAGAIYKVREYFPKLLHWMLEEEDSIIFWKQRKGKIRNQKLGKQ